MAYDPYASVASILAQFDIRLTAAEAGGAPTPTLIALSLSPTTATVGSPYSGNVTGKTTGSVLSLTGAGAAGLNASGSTVTGTPTTAGAVNIVETLAGATNTPRTNNTALTVSVTLTLGTLTLSGTLTNGTASSGTINGATTGSSIVSNVTGLTVNSGARTYSFDGSAVAATTANGLVETLAGATGSPKSSPLTVVAAAIVPLTYTLVNNFETTAGAPSSGLNALTLDTSSRKVLGTSGVRAIGNSTNTAQTVNTIQTITEDMASWDRIVISVDVGSGYENALSTLRPRFIVGATTYDYRTDTANGVAANTGFDAEQRGKRWLSFKADRFRATDFNGIKITDAGTASKTLALTMNAFTPGSAATDFVYDALVRPAFHKPVIMMTWDDVNATQYNFGFPELQSRGLVATMYGADGLFTGGDKLTTSQAQEMINAGFAMGVDSDATDKPLTAYPNLAAAVAALNANRDALAARFTGIGTGGQHLCYSYGSVGYQTTTQTVTVTGGTGTDTVTVSGTDGFAKAAAGQRAFGTNVPAGTIVVSAPEQNQIKFNQVIPAGVTTIRLAARVQGITVTATGSTVVALSSTTDLFVGQHMLGYTVPTDTRIVSIDSSTQITVDKAVPSTCKLANFGYVDGEFWPTKVLDAMIANGYKTGRRSNAPYGIYSGFGVDVLATIGAKAVSWDLATGTAANIAQMQAHVREGNDFIAYLHQPGLLPQTQAGMDHFRALADAIKALVDAGEAECLTVPAYWTKVSARLPIA